MHGSLMVILLISIYIYVHGSLMHRVNSPSILWVSSCVTNGFFGELQSQKSHEYHQQAGI